MVREVSKILNKKFTKSNAVFLLFFLTFFGIFFLNFVSAAPILDQLHLNIQTTDGSGNVVTGTFNFQFNISTTSDCLNVVYSNTTSLTTDSRGIVSYYLNNTGLDYQNQYYLCYYRDGGLIETSPIARTPYSFTAQNTTVSGIIVDSNLNLGGYNATAAWFNGLFNWTTADFYNSFNGYSLSFNETKLNQTIQSFGYVTGASGNDTYVPYTGASSNVNLGSYNLTGAYFFGNGAGLTGIRGSQINNDFNWINYTLLSQFTNDLGIGNWSADKGNYYNITQVDSQISSANTSIKNYVDTNYVPYTGATGNVNLGSNNLTAAYFFGDGSYLTNINRTAVNYWTQSGSDIYYNLGNVGIGTVPTLGALDVNGSVYASDFIDRQNTAYYLNPAGTSNLNSADFAGNVGIGTTVPSEKLEVAGDIALTGSPTGASVITRKNINGLLQLDGGDAWNTGGSIYLIGQNFSSASATPGDVQFSLGETSANYRFYNFGASSELVRITNSGNVGIGTTAPAAKLDVQGEVKFQSSGVTTFSEGGALVVSG